MDSMSPSFNREAVVTAVSDGHFRLISSPDAHPLTSILFNNRKAARNWALGRGYRVREGAPPGGH